MNNHDTDIEAFIRDCELALRKSSPAHTTCDLNLYLRAHWGLEKSMVETVVSWYLRARIQYVQRFGRFPHPSEARYWPMCCVCLRIGLQKLYEEHNEEAQKVRARVLANTRRPNAQPGFEHNGA